MQSKPSLITNGAFDRDLTGWAVRGSAKVENGKLLLDAGKSSVRQRFAMQGLHILSVGATVKSDSKDVLALVRLRCLDAQGRTLMDQTGTPNKDGQAGIYLKTHAYTAAVEVSIEKSTMGKATADDIWLTDDDRDRVQHAPQVDLKDAMIPFWQGEVVRDESVLLLSQDGGDPSGKLLFESNEILSVKDSSLTKEYVRDRDYRIEGKCLVALKDSTIPTMKDTEFAKGQYPWTELQGHHIFVTYRHQDHWTGPLPQFQGEYLTKTTEKLAKKKSLRIVAFGDSITLGINVSGFRNVPPYLPPWPTLVAHELERRTGSKVTLYNTALGGMTSQWAKDNAHDAVATLKPDLVLLAFGMNDFWSLEPKYFFANIKATIATIRKANPNCEFLLIGSMKFDPVYTTEEPYVGNLAGYPAVLRSLVGRGIGMFDMTELSDALYRAKSQKDLATDPMHPDDFFARIYAQGVVASLLKP